MIYLHMKSDDFFYIDDVSDDSILSYDGDSVDDFIQKSTVKIKSMGYDIFTIGNNT